MQRIVIIVIIGMVLITGCALRPSATTDQNNVNSAQIAELEATYRGQLHDALAPFFASNQVKGIRTTLLDLRTPHRYLDLHIGLVYAFDQIEQGRLESDQAKIEAGFEQIHGLADQHEWVR